MSKIIEARVAVNPDYAVSCIRSIRDATGVSLSLAKETFDYIRAKGSASVRFTPEEFGRMQLDNIMHHAWLFGWYEIHIVDEVPQDYIVLGKAVPALAG